MRMAVIYDRKAEGTRGSRRGHVYFPGIGRQYLLFNSNALVETTSPTGGVFRSVRASCSMMMATCR